MDFLMAEEAKSVPLMKLCRLCNTTKPITEFHRKTGSYSNSYCKPCANEKTARWRESNPEKRKEYNSNWRPHYLKSKYGITQSEYERIYVSQSGKCAICGDKHELLHIDHSHGTGSVRGLLCGPCNRGIGLLRESAEILSKAIEYLAIADSKV